MPSLLHFTGYDQVELLLRNEAIEIKVCTVYQLLQLLL
jgi:hypothetical protein